MIVILWEQWKEESAICTLGSVNARDMSKERNAMNALSVSNVSNVAYWARFKNLCLSTGWLLVSQRSPTGMLSLRL